MNKKKIIRYSVIVLLIAAAIFAYTRWQKSKNKPEWRTDQSSTGSIREVVTATGSLNPFILVEVGTEVSGKIEKVYKDFNDQVRKGDLLAKLDTEILETSLAAARSDLAKAQTSVAEAKYKYELAAELYSKNMASEYEAKVSKFAYDQALQQLKSTQISTQRAEKNLANATITSPIDGVIVSRDVETGQTVAASLNSPVLFKIANNLDQMQITAEVDEADIGKIHPGLPVEFNVDAYPNENFEGSVKQVRLNPTNNENVVSYSVIIDADNPEHKLLPGMTTNVTIVIQAKEEVVRLPETATRFRPSKEIWTQMGLKWSDDLLSAGRKPRSGGPSLNPTGAPASPDPKIALKPGARPAGADSLKSKRPRGTKPALARGQAPAVGTGQFSSGTSGAPRRRGFAMVWILGKDGQPSPIPIQTGISDGAFVEVIEGLAPGTTVLTGVNFKNSKQAAAAGPGGPMGRF